MDLQNLSLMIYVNMPEKMRGLGTLTRYLGFKTTKMPIEHAARAEGRRGGRRLRLRQIPPERKPLTPEKEKTA